MKKSILLVLGIILLLSYACDKVTVDITYPPLTQHQKDVKPGTPVALGSIRAYFGDYYRTFSQNLWRDQPVDSLSNLYTYGEFRGTQIYHLSIRRSDSDFVFEINIHGYPLDSLPLNTPLPEVYGKYPEISYYPFYGDDHSYYSLAYYFQKCVFIITDKTDDILTGTFSGMLESSSGLLPLSDGEFKIKVFRKKMNYVQNK